METLGFAFLLSLLAGLSTLLGGLIAYLIRKPKQAYLAMGFGFSAGVMIFVSFVELLPLGIEKLGIVPAFLSFFAGVLFIYLVDVLVPHMYEAEESCRKDTKLKRCGLMLFLGIAIHNFPEGIAVMFSSLSSPKLGIPIALAVALHNIPEGIAIAIPIYYSTKSRLKALWYTFVAGMAEPFGALLAWLVLMRFMTENLLFYVLAAVAGIMVFISFDELLPEALAYRNRHLIILGIFSGMLVMAISLLFF
jgi:zinc transporter, ZIP family